MPIHKSLRLKFKPESVEKCKQALQEYVALIEQNEPGTLFYVCLQEEDDPTCFFLYGIFEDTTARDKHDNSTYIKHYWDFVSAETIEPPISARYGVLASVER